jgi:cytochrome c551/c552
MKRILSIFLFSGLVILTGCVSEVEEDLYPDCTSNVTYSVTIRGLLNSYGCLGCHTGASPSGGFVLTDYNAVKAKVNDNGKLLKAIMHAPGAIPMPQTGGKMSDCDIKKVQAWIAAGTPNN